MLKPAFAMPVTQLRSSLVGFCDSCYWLMFASQWPCKHVLLGDYFANPDKRGNRYYRTCYDKAAYIISQAWLPTTFFKERYKVLASLSGCGMAAIDVVGSLLVDTGKTGHFQNLPKHICLLKLKKINYPCQGDVHNWHSGAPWNKEKRKINHNIYAEYFRSFQICYNKNKSV